MKIKVCVTKQDIEKGKQHNCEKCPVALAVRRALRGNKGLRLEGVGYHFGLGSFNFHVNYESAKLLYGEVEVNLPKGKFVVSKVSVRVARFMQAFDEFNPEFLKDNDYPHPEKTVAEHEGYKKQIKPFSFTLCVPDAKKRKAAS